MFCNKCGRELPEGAVFCSACGAPAPLGADAAAAADSSDATDRQAGGDPSPSSAPSGGTGHAAPAAVPPPIPPQAAAQPQAQRTHNDNIALASLVCGVIGLFCSPTLIIGIALGVIAIVLASSHRKAGGTSTLATVGKVCGIIDLALAAILFILFTTVGCTTFAIVGNAALESASRAESTESGADTIENGTGGTTGTSEPATVELTDAEVEDISNQVAAYLDPIFAQDSEAIDELAALADGEFEEVFGFGLDEAGVGAREYVLWRLEGMSWEISSIEAYSDGTAIANISLNSCYRRDVHSAFEYLMDVYVERGGDIHDPERVGQVLAASQEMFYNTDVPDWSGIDRTSVPFRFVQLGDGSYAPQTNTWDYQMRTTFAPLSADSIGIVLADEELCLTYEMYPPEEYADPYLEGII